MSLRRRSAASPPKDCHQIVIFPGRRQERRLQLPPHPASSGVEWGKSNGAAMNDPNQNVDRDVDARGFLNMARKYREAADELLEVRLRKISDPNAQDLRDPVCF